MTLKNDELSVALEALRDLSSPRASVLRDGQLVVIPGREVVSGDVVRVSEGDRVPADGAPTIVPENHDPVSLRNELARLEAIERERAAQDVEELVNLLLSVPLARVWDVRPCSRALPA